MCRIPIVCYACYTARYCSPACKRKDIARHARACAIITHLSHTHSGTLRVLHTHHDRIARNKRAERRASRNRN
jgi:hypothetical protein